MPQELTPEQIFNAEDPEKSVPRDIINGRPKEEIIDDLQSLEYKKDEAEAFIYRIEELINIVENHPEKMREVNKFSRQYNILGVSFMLVAAGIFIVSLAGPVVIAAGGLFVTGFAFILKADSYNKSLKNIQKLLKENNKSSD